MHLTLAVWLTDVGHNSWWHETCSTAHNQPQILKDGIIQTSEVTWWYLKILKDPPTWLTLEKDPNHLSNHFYISLTVSQWYHMVTDLCQHGFKKKAWCLTAPSHYLNRYWLITVRSHGCVHSYWVTWCCPKQQVVVIETLSIKFS